MKVDESTWKFFQKHLGYTDAEMKKFRQNPRNEAVLQKAPVLTNKTIVAEVIESRGCNSRHKVGDKFYFDGSGNLLTKLCPGRICIYILQPMAGIISAINELIWAGVDPNEIKFRRAGCFDVGVDCGGWGRVVVEVSVQERQKDNK